MANLIPATQTIRANTAGVKQQADQVKNVAQTDTARFVRGVTQTLHLTGGPHPESLLVQFSQALSEATDSIRGPHGGTVPQLSSVTAPGPAGGVNASAAGLNAAGVHQPSTATKTTSLLDKVKGLFGG